MKKSNKHVIRVMIKDAVAVAIQLALFLGAVLLLLIIFMTLIYHFTVGAL